MKAAIVLVLALAGAKPFPFDEWDALLKQHVDERGRVDYAKVDRAALDRLVAAVAAPAPVKPPTTATKAAREAYYLDAYNVLVWKGVLARLPKHPNDDDAGRDAFFHKARYTVTGDEVTLGDLETTIRTTFKDPRVHFALNCASAGCPRLPREAFVPDKLDAQLDREARTFCNERRNVDFDAATKRLKLSHIFDWYKDDFGGAPAQVIAWINRHRPDGAKLPTDAKIEYVDYDWSLNIR
jgi:uncharacterized protein DUF547